jgi:ADP-ribose pyrophosphatase
MAQPETLYRGKFLSLVKEGHWEYVDRVNATGAIIVVALTDHNKMLLVEQDRIPCHGRTIELPAGITGDEPGSGDEPLIDAARRELLEETGYLAKTLAPLVSGPASSGLTSETVTFFLATDLTRQHEGGGVGHEDIFVHEIPVSYVPSFLVEFHKTGLLVDPKVYAGLYFLEQHLRERRRKRDRRRNPFGNRY